MAAKRFDILSGETNTPVVDFYNAVDVSVLNKDRSNAVLNPDDLVRLQSVAKTGDVPNTYKLNQVLKSSNNLLRGADNATKDSVVDLLAVSPSYAKIMDLLSRMPGGSGLTKGIPMLLKQIANSDVLSSAAKSVRSVVSGRGSDYKFADFTGVFHGIPNISEILDKLKGYAGLPKLSTDTLDTIHRITRNPALNVMLAGVVGSVTIGRLTNLLFPRDTPTANTVAGLPPTIKQKVVVEAGSLVPHNPSTIPNTIGRPVPVSPNPDLGKYISVINKLVPDLIPTPTPSPVVSATIITSIVQAGMDMGISTIFNDVSRVINNPVATVAAGVAVMNLAVSAGNIDVILNVAQSPYALTIGSLSPGLGGQIISSINIPSNMSNADMLVLGHSLIGAIDTLDPTWRSSTGVGGISELTTANLDATNTTFIKILTILAMSTGLSMPDLVATPTTVIPTVASMDQWTYWASTYKPDTVMNALGMIFKVVPFKLV